jgi:hypothetical protein
MMKKQFRINAVVVMAVAALVVSVVGCSDDDDSPLVPQATGLGTGAMLRAVHASPDAPAVDIYVEGVSTPVSTNLAYGGATGYLNLAPATYNIQLRAAGASASSPPAYETGNLAIALNDKITAVAMGLLNSGAASDKFRVVPYIENFAAPGAGKVAVRIIHGSADAPTVGLDVGDDGNAEVANFARFAETGDAGVALDAGTALQIGILAGSQRVTAFTTPALPDGGELFVIATGLLAKLPRETDGFTLLAIAPTGPLGFIKQNPVVFALHGSPDAPAVDIDAGTTEIIDNLSFGELSAAVQVPPGSYTLNFRAHDDAAIAATAMTPALVAGERYLAIASGFLSKTPSFTLLPYGDGFGLGDSAARVRVVHASPDAPAVDVGTVAGNVVSPVADFTNLAFAGASSAAGTSLPVGALSIGIATTGSTAPVATFTVNTASGLRAYAVAAGSLGGSGASFRLVIVNTSAFPWSAAEIQPN